MLTPYCAWGVPPIHCLLFKLCSIIKQVLKNSGKKHCIMDIEGKYHNFSRIINIYGINFKLEPDICYEKTNWLT